MAATEEQLMQMDESLLSIAQKFRLPKYREQASEFFSTLTKTQIANLKYDYKFNARPKQLPPPGDWTFWLINCGRGFGKTWTGASWIKEQEALATKAGKKLEIGIFGAVYQETERTMVQAILDMYPESTRPIYTANKKTIKWKSGTIAHVIQGGQTPEKLRSLNLNVAWVDELAKFQYPLKFWDQLMFCLRKGEDIKCLITTTPAIAVNKLLKEIINGDYGKCVRTKGTTDENTELNTLFKSNVHKKYDGTRLGSQELSGDLLEDITGSLWKRQMIKSFETFIREETQKNQNITKEFIDKYLTTQLRKVVVAIDPAMTTNINSDESGIVVSGRNNNDQGFVLRDCSGKLTPNEQADVAVKLYYKYKASCIVAECNNGGDYIKAMIHNVDPKVKVELVRATKGKMVRAEPISMLYEQGKMYHCPSEPQEFDILEDQLCNYTGHKGSKVDDSMAEDNKIKSPDRMDALVWSFTHLFSDKIAQPGRGPIPFTFSNF